MSNAYNRSNKSTGRTKGINQHRGPDDAHFSNMQVVDTKEGHKDSIKNMSAVPSHVKAFKISDKVPYKRQSHAVKPSGPIQSFVGNRVDGTPGEEAPTKRPGDGGKGYYKPDKKG